MGGEISQGQDRRSVLRLTEGSNQRPCGATYDGFGLYQDLCAQRRLEGMGEGRLSDRTEIGVADRRRADDGPTRGGALLLAAGESGRVAQGQAAFSGKR